MRVTRLSVKNFKGLRDIDIPVSRFVCVIGENNAGKSSLLQALDLFIEGTKITPDVYFDRDSPVTISARIESISESDLSLITNEEHRSRFKQILTDEAITLVRRYELNGSSRLRWIARIPTEARFHEDTIADLLSGKKPGQAFAEEMAKAFPEIANQFDVKTNQKQARAIIEELASKLPDSAKDDTEMDLPSGIDNSIRPFLPVPIYIPAVKDLADEIATKDSASFGKLLGILLTQIAPELEKQEETFKHLRVLLNKIVQDDGSTLDNRLEAVRNIETTVREFVRENFRNVELELRIPPPEIKAILSSAEIWVNDGVQGPVTTKGDGLKRTVTFSILRSYVELRRRQRESGSAPAPTANYLLLFEEPELYLHPKAQRILFDALAELSQTNHVFVSTHSPLFFGGEATKTFIKLAKRHDASIASKPFTEGFCVDLLDMNAKSRFQIISYETNNSAFFSNTVVLVEGDSDLIVMPHIAHTINNDWDLDTTGITFCRIGGKGNIAKYRDFFKSFKVEVHVITDLDCLIEGFDSLEPSPESLKLRNQLIQMIDAIIKEESIEARITAKDVREIQRSQVKYDQFQILKEAIIKFKEGTATAEDVNTAEAQFFSDLIRNKRCHVLQDTDRPEITTAKQELIASLRKQRIHVLERGEIEDYYPASVTGTDKPSRAIEFCRQQTDRDVLLALCGDTICLDGTKRDKEFTVLFGSIFEADT